MILTISLVNANIDWKRINHMLDILYNLHSQVLEGVNEDLDLLSGHLLWLESRAKGNKDSSL